jgi:mono/diheme cytochrome c family protein
MRNLLVPLALLAIFATSAFAADAAAGKAVYDRACKTCHGADGKANPAIAKAMNVEIKDLKSPEVQSMSDADLKKIVMNGKGKMPPVKTVTGTQLDNLVAYVKNLK